MLEVIFRWSRPTIKGNALPVQQVAIMIRPGSEEKARDLRFRPPSALSLLGKLALLRRTQLLDLGWEARLP